MYPAVLSLCMYPALCAVPDRPSPDEPMEVRRDATRPGVTKANFDRIEKGMTIRQVYDILGDHGVRPDADLSGAILIWHAADGAQAHVQFYESGAVPRTWHESTESIPDKLWRWLRLPNGASHVKSATLQFGGLYR